ncbi:MAG TPA: helix-turn-helix domain-containing protein [Terriglobia bacterium]
MTTVNSVEEKIVSSGTGARILGISERTVRYYCEIGQLRAYKLGKSWHIYRSSLDDLIRQRSNDLGIKESAIAAGTAVAASVSKHSPVRR